MRFFWGHIQPRRRNITSPLAKTPVKYGECVDNFAQPLLPHNCTSSWGSSLAILAVVSPWESLRPIALFSRTVPKAPDGSSITYNDHQHYTRHINDLRGGSRF